MARANYKVAAANVDLAKAAILQAVAALKVAKTNLDYTIIKSPVEATIVTRRVNIGQTVVAALNAPSLFLIAKDLRRIQVWASVNETDIGLIRSGMPVEFTVDAYPNDTFRGKVIQIRLNAQSTQNVVTYTVVVETDNSDRRLLPYMTANVKFLREQHVNVLMVPNAALRWKPQKRQIAPDARQAGKGGQKQDVAKTDEGSAKSSAEPTPATPGKEAAKPKEPDRGQVWVVDGNYVRPIAVQIGASDETLTEVSGGSDLEKGLKVVIGENLNQDAGDETTNPFGPPKFMKGGAKKTEK
jgi:HlyD family secretion protein